MVETNIIVKLPTKVNSKGSYNKSSKLKLSIPNLSNPFLSKLELPILKDWICYPTE